MSKQRFLNALERKNPLAQPALGSGTSVVCQELFAHTGIGFPEAHLDPEKMAALALTAHTVLGYDAVMPLFSVCHEAAAMGCNVNWGHNNAMPEGGPPIFRSEADIRIPADFLTHPGCTVPLEAIRLLKKRLGDSAAVIGKAFGAWTQGYHYFGVENFLIMTLDDPAQVHRIMDKLLPAAIQFARAQLEAGADAVVFADHVTRDLCSPQAYEEFVMARQKRAVGEIAGPLIVHTCGNTSDRIAAISRTGIACFHWDTKTGAPELARQLAGERMALMGGISNRKLLVAQPEEIAADARAAAAAGIDIVGPECAIPLSTPIANLRAITDAFK